MSEVINSVAEVFISSNSLEIEVTAPACPEVVVEALGARGEKGSKGDSGEGSAELYDPGDLTLHFNNAIL